MRQQFHILNGDALMERFPAAISGEVIVFRECLVDGEVAGNELEDLFKSRSQFLSSNYDNVSKEDYYSNSAAEILKINEIPPNSEINLWFEEDLFCQVNFWFCVHLILSNNPQASIYLIRPEENIQLGFSAYSETQLVLLYKQRSFLKQTELLVKLWALYQSGDTEALAEIAGYLKHDFPFISAAVKAHIARIPKDGKPGQLEKTLIAIIDDLGTTDFVPIFREFQKREAIYGFGDLQVKRLLDAIIQDRER